MLALALLRSQPVLADADVDRSGGSSSKAPHISRSTSLRGCVHLVRSGPRRGARRGSAGRGGSRGPTSSSARWQPTIAILMMSAEVPWIGMLTALRSPWPRTCGRPERSSGIGRRRPSSVVDVALLRGELDRLLDVALHRREALEVAVDVGAGLVLLDVETIGEAVGGEPVGDAVVDHLGLRALAGADLLGRSRGPRRRSRRGCPRRGRRSRGARPRRRCGPGSAARSGCSRRRAGGGRAARRSRSGSGGPRRCGSGCSGDSGWCSRAGRSRSPSG